MSKPNEALPDALEEKCRASAPVRETRETLALPRPMFGRYILRRPKGSK
jgi:hypothetical protein